MMKESRLLDANINRSAEGLRVLEDIARFRFDNVKISSDIRQLRHEVRALFKGREHELLSSRDPFNDVGVKTSSRVKTDTRKNLKDTVLSNFKRVQEAFRSLEEILKAEGEYRAGKNIEKLRFQAYSLEFPLLALFTRQLPKGIYGILGEKFSLGRSNVDVAKIVVDAGIDILQYHEKLTDKSLKKIHEECHEIRKITQDAGVLFIVNDYVDVALMVNADGVHQGQDDLPVRRVRKIAPDMMIGCSTHSSNQAERAITDGADYIGVGPIFATHTIKDEFDPVGFEYLDHIVAHHTIPFVAVGGIRRHNIREVLSRGAKTIGLSFEIINAENIEKRIKDIKAILREYN